MPDSPDLRANWIRYVSSALFCPHISSRALLQNIDTSSMPPFYGFFQTLTWHNLMAHQPDAAHDLSLFLYIQGALYGSDSGLIPDS